MNAEFLGEIMVQNGPGLGTIGCQTRPIIHLLLQKMLLCYFSLEKKRLDLSRSVESLWSKCKHKQQGTGDLHSFYLYIQALFRVFPKMYLLTFSILQQTQQQTVTITINHYENCHLTYIRYEQKHTQEQHKM